jgi:hypothetical protein
MTPLHAESATAAADGDAAREHLIELVKANPLIRYEKTDPTQECPLARHRASPEPATNCQAVLGNSQGTAVFSPFEN